MPYVVDPNVGSDAMKAALPNPTGDPATEWWRAPVPGWTFVNENGQLQEFYGGAIIPPCNCYDAEPEGQYGYRHDWYIDRHGRRMRHVGTSASRHLHMPCGGCPGYDGRGCPNAH